MILIDTSAWLEYFRATGSHIATWSASSKSNRRTSTAAAEKEFACQRLTDEPP